MLMVDVFFIILYESVFFLLYSVHQVLSIVLGELYAFLTMLVKFDQFSTL